MGGPELALTADAGRVRARCASQFGQDAVAAMAAAGFVLALTAGHPTRAARAVVLAVAAGDAQLAVGTMP